MPAKLICVMLLLFVSFAAESQEQEHPTLDEQHEVLSRFEPYTGHWQAVQRVAIPQVADSTLQWDGGPILNGQAYLYRGVHTADEIPNEYLLIIGYDWTEGSYVQWYHDPISNDKMLLTWSEDGRSYTVSQLPRDVEPGFFVESIITMVDDHTMRNRFSARSNAGGLLMDSSWEAHPTAGEIEFAQEELAPDEPDPLAMMRHHTGRWVSTVNGRATDLIEEPYEYGGEWTGREILGGRAMLYEGTAQALGGEYSYIWLYTYDEYDEHYLAWYHDSLGNHGKFHGQWSPERSEMTLTLQDPERYGYDITFVDRYVDADTLEFSFRMTLEDGRVVTHESGTATRVQEEGVDQ